MFLTPAAEPVWGGTYFPKESKFGRPAFTDILREVSRLFREEPGKIEQNRAALLVRLAEKVRPAGRVTIGLKELDAAAKQIGNAFDAVYGGLRGAPKFPQPAILEMLWRAGLRTGNSKFFETVEHSLERMSEGGIYDHLGGGFSRYSVDERWLVPVSKCLRQRPTVGIAGAGLSTQPQPAVRHPRARNGRMAQARDDHRRGGVFRFPLMPIRRARRASSTSGRRRKSSRSWAWKMLHSLLHIMTVSEEGNFEGHNILNYLNGLPRSMEDGDPWLGMLRSMLRQKREERVRPGLDDKVLADWNALDDRFARECRRHSGRQPSWLVVWPGRPLILCGKIDDQGRPARPLLARRQIVVSRTGVGFCRHDPRRTRPARGDRRTGAYSSGAHLAARLRHPLRQSADRGHYLTAADADRSIRTARILPSTTPPQSNAVAAQNLSAARRCFTATTPGVSKPIVCSRAVWQAVGTICSRTCRCSTRSICVCAQPRLW